MDANVWLDDLCFDLDSISSKDEDCYLFSMSSLIALVSPFITLYNSISKSNGISLLSFSNKGEIVSPFDHIIDL